MRRLRTKRMATTKLWLLALFCLAAVSCRTETSGTLSEPMDAQDEQPWFDMDGEGAVCETPPKACAVFDYEKEFVDLCVEKGGKAKTCGCTMRCSTKIEYTRLKPKPGVAAVVKTDDQDPSLVCTEGERVQIAAVAEGRRPGSDADRCIEDYLCQGTTERCQESEIPGVEKMRSLAGQGCNTEVYTTLCRNGFVDSNRCPAAHIKALTSVQLALSDKVNAARRCTRNVLCFDSIVGCDGKQKADADSYKKLLNHDGCEYWLRKLCSLD